MRRMEVGRTPSIAVTAGDGVGSFALILQDNVPASCSQDHAMESSHVMNLQSVDDTRNVTEDRQ